MVGMAHYLGQCSEKYLLAESSLLLTTHNFPGFVSIHDFCEQGVKYRKSKQLEPFSVVVGGGGCTAGIEKSII